VLAAEPARFATRTVLQPLDECERELPAVRDDAIRASASELCADGFATPDSTSVKVALRLVGQESTIEVQYGTASDMRDAFMRRFREIFGYAPPARAIEVVSVEARSAAAATALPPDLAPLHAAPAAQEPARILSEGAWTEARVIARAALAPGASIEGPALLTDMGETVVIDRSWRARVADGGDLVAERATPSVPRTGHAEQELFAARLEAIAVSMGNVLERTALSPNIRDRLDFSCAILDAAGTLIQNAPHLPVHLGALGVCTRAVMAELPLADGDIAVTNHPAFGGSHLPDVTTVAPVFVDGARVAFVAVRAHHAEIGGTRPGSFPPDARSLDEEGVVLAPFLAVRAGAFDADGCRARFAGGAYPSRNPDENIADLQAQIAATRYGVAKVAALARELAGQFAARCEGELVRADLAARRALVGHESACPSSVRLDDGTAISAEIASPDSRDARWRIRVASDVARHPRNFNAPFAVTRAAVLYVLRLLINRPVPMNEGLLRGIDLVVPPCMLNPAFSRNAAECPPVVAGNVETSQSVVAALISNLKLSAESQSTMNNVLFGNDRFTIYETLGGGAGAGPEGPGASAVHVHMSNTRLTDIDVLERRAPVVIRRFEVRRGSGGLGAHAGGDGMVREYEFREPVSLSFFGSRRVHAPQSVNHGIDGSCGIQHTLVAGEHATRSDAVLALDLAAGDRFTVETPGGGGWTE
jgi:5-oxoprolinase (ATP-hydrolysing)